MTLQIPVSTALLTVDLLPSNDRDVLKQAPVLSYNLRKRKWFGQFVDIDIVDDWFYIPCTKITFSDQSSVKVASRTRILCRTNDSNKYFTVSADSAMVGMVCVTPTDMSGCSLSKMSRRYITAIEPVTKKQTMHCIIPEMIDYVTIDPGIVICV